MSPSIDVRTLAHCPVCGAKMGQPCVEISVPTMRGKAGSGSLSKFRKTLQTRQPHSSRADRSANIEACLAAIAGIARALRVLEAA